METTKICSKWYDDLDANYLRYFTTEQLIAELRNRQKEITATRTKTIIEQLKEL